MKNNNLIKTALKAFAILGLCICINCNGSDSQSDLENQDKESGAITNISLIASEFCLQDDCEDEETVADDSADIDDETDLDDEKNLDLVEDDSEFADEEEV